MSAETEIVRLFADAGVRGWLHASPVGGEDAETVDIDGGARVVMASVYKLPLLVAFCRLVDRGVLDPVERVELVPTLRTSGGTGIAAMDDAVSLSRRDLARSMITVSDNSAGDALLDDVGLSEIGSTLVALGLESTRIVGGTRDVQRILVEDMGSDDLAQAMEMLDDNDIPPVSRALDPLLASVTTARDMTALLRAIWTDTAASPEQCSFMRTVLGQQIWPHRLRAGFPYQGVMVSGKTGSLGPLRHEVGVVEHRRESPIAVAVFTHAARSDVYLPRVDAVIGAAARTAVSALRWS